MTLTPTVPETAARAEAYRLLARAPRSAAEVEMHLTRRGFTSAAVAAALQALHDLGYIDDAALAERRAEELMLRRGYGRLRVSHELTRRGLADTVIAAAIASVLHDRGDAEIAREALRKKFRGASLASCAERGRAFRFLLGRGHPSEIASEVLDDET